jgi:hypothetical protein
MYGSAITGDETRNGKMMNNVRKDTCSASTHRTIFGLLLAAASISLAACADGNGGLQFGGAPFWQPPHHISDNRPN